MRKKREVKHKKRPKKDTTNDEATLARLEAVKLKRQETIAMVKRRLDEKFNERTAFVKANMLKDEQEREKMLGHETKSLNERIMMQIRDEMKTVMIAGVEKAHAAKVLNEKVRFELKSSTMIISGKKYKIKKNIHAVGWGREALMLGSALEKIIGRNLKKGWIVLPRKTIASMSKYPEWFPKLDTRITFTEARSDDIPDEVCVKATKNIMDYCKKLKKKDILVVILSRGSDDLLCMPKGTIGLSEKIVVLEQLRNANATESEIGIVRKFLSAVRAGGLASLAHPAKVISLVMSDLGPDDLHLDDISGGPTIKTDHHALLLTARSILEKYNLHAHKLSHGIREVLKDNPESSIISVNKPTVSFADNYVVASTMDALDEMAVMAFRLGYVPIKMAASTAISSSSASLSLRRISRDYTRLVSLMILAVENKITPTEMYRDICEKIITFDMTEQEFLKIFPSKENWARGLYLLISPPADFMGNRAKCYKSREFPSSTKTGNNQELALYFSLDWYLRVEQYPILREYVVWFLGGATDGHDGNTEYAGAYAYGNLGVDVYRQFKNYDLTGSGKIRKDVEDEEKRTIHESILPHHVLTSGNVNFLFLNVNNGEELLKLGDTEGCTHTKVGDLHVVRIVRCQCNCNGLCTTQ